MIPPTLAANPRLDRWVGFNQDRTVLIGFGKVEYGQGVATALAQIGAEELDVAMSTVRVAEPSTEHAPDEGMTVGSMSIEMSGAAVRAACAQVRAVFLAHAAKVLSCPLDELTVREGAFFRAGAATGYDYWALAGEVDLNRPPTEDVTYKDPGQYSIVGQSQPRFDLPPKVFGGAFIHDILPEGVLHARVLRQPGEDAKLVGYDEARIRQSAGDAIEILREGAFVAFLSTSEGAARRALDAALASALWEGARSIPSDSGRPGFLKTLPAEDIDAGAPRSEPSNRRKFTAVYTKPYLAHGPIGPSCALAQYVDGALKIWTHAQGVFPLRQMIARLLGLPIDKIVVVHAQGPGNYGHNGADDAAVDAAIIAFRRPGKPIRVAWRREDEFGYSPVGPAMQIELTAELDAAGRIADFSSEIWSGAHVNRGRPLAQSALGGAPAGSVSSGALASAPPGPRFSGGSLNAVPSYDIGVWRVREHLIAHTPVRTSALRGLGGPPNEFAGECFMDELAAGVGQDPLAFRLSMMSDARGRAVLETVAEMSNWASRGPGGAGLGLGLAYARHRGRGARTAVVCALEVDREVRLSHIWCAADCGLIVNPNGAINQIEGGIIMAASWALKEQVRLGGAGVETLTWGDYPILRFDEAPPVDVQLLDRPDEPACGIGEISSGPAMAAIGNALAHALGVRLRDMPFTRERIAEVLLA